jgi:hypothetical protein
MNISALAPSIVLGLITATMLAAIAHLMRGHTLHDLLSIWLAVQIGFWVVALVAAWLRAPLFTVGELQLGAGLIGGVTSLGIAIVTHKRV